MAESGCLMSKKLRALTVNHNIKTKDFESNELLELSGDISITEDTEITETDGNLDFEQKNVGNSEYPNEDIFLKEAPGGSALDYGRQPTLRRDLIDPSEGYYINGELRSDLQAAFQGSDGFSRLHDTDTDLQGRVNPSSGEQPYTILQPGNSILKNMYILVRNNNFSVTQFLGNEETASFKGLRSLELTEGEIPNIYDEIGLRLNVSIGENSADIQQNNFFEEKNSGGGDIVIVPGNYGDTHLNDGGASNTPTSGIVVDEAYQDTAIPPNRRPIANGRRPIFRHNGVLLGKDTLIPVITNYTFSSPQQKLSCINQNGYSGNYETIEMDNIRMTVSGQEATSLYNSLSTPRKIHITVDASSSTLTAGPGDFDAKVKTGKLTGADFLSQANALTQPRINRTEHEEDDTTYDPNVGYELQEYDFWERGTIPPTKTILSRVSAGSGSAAFTGKTTLLFDNAFASNFLRDNVYIHPELKEVNNGVCTGLPPIERVGPNDYSNNQTPDYGNEVEFKVICDFQQL